MKKNGKFIIEKRMTGYSTFKCIADKCKFTCCSGWDINIDNNIYNKWTNEKSSCNYILEKININNYEDMIVDKKTSDPCPFLDNKGLCNIVKNNGDEYLSLTCARVPRVENEFEGIKEFTQSCACPEVVDIIGKGEEDILLNTFKSEIEIDIPIEIKLRDTLVKIIKEQDIRIEEKLLIAYDMLLNILNNDELTEENVLEEINKYSDKNYIKMVSRKFNNSVNYNKSFRVINNLFLDITENYKRVPLLKDALTSVSNISMKIYRNQINTDELLDKWNSFINDFNDHNKLIENCIIAKVLSNCINEDIEEVALGLELIILEYLLIKYSVFLNYAFANSDTLMQDIKDYIVVFSRIIENNSDAVIEFIEEQYGDILYTSKYLQKICMI